MSDIKENLIRRIKSIRHLLLILFFICTSICTADSQQITGRETKVLKPVDNLMTEFLQQHDVPGASLAITKDGRLVYARGFGWANQEEKIPVQPDSLFRIASICKPFISVAILQLIEKEKLNFSNKVYEILTPEIFANDNDKIDPRIRQINIYHLLTHSGGVLISRDPMGALSHIASSINIEPPPTKHDIILYMAQRSVDFDIGTKVEYSNYGYFALERVVEKVTGNSFEQYANENIFKPLKIKRMLPARTSASDCAPDEVIYYDIDNRMRTVAYGPHKGEVVPAPYGGNYFEVMGGWAASSIDLMRFAASFDNPDNCPILSKMSISKMFERPKYPFYKEASYYSLGWNVNEKKGGVLTTWHTGAMSGTSGLMIRRGNGISVMLCYSICVITRTMRFCIICFLPLFEKPFLA